MDEPERSARFAKDTAEEERIAQMNVMLEPAQAELEKGLVEPKLPVVMVIGAPRSGTTLTGQILAACGSFGYISNFVARFWRAPAVGTRIERSLSLWKGAEIDFASSHGVTRGWSNSHEFGYFWSSFFDRGQETHRLSKDELGQIDAAHLRRAIASIEAEHGLPLVFKNNSWCTLQADYLAKLLPTAIFVVCRRNPLYVAQSFLKTRRERYGDERMWWSVRPSTYQSILAHPPHHQVVFQALEIEREMNELLEAVSPQRIVDARYERVCAEPMAFVDEVERKCVLRDADPALLRRLPQHFESTDVQRVDDEDWKRLQQALDAYPKFLSDARILRETNSS